MKKIISFIILLLLLSSCTFGGGGAGYKVTLKYNNGTSNKTIQIDGELNVEDPIRDGYVFMGWYLGDELFTGIVEANITLSAKWVEEGTKYPIYYDLGGGFFEEDAPSSYLAGEEFVLPIPTKKYHEFDGWYLDSDLTNGPIEKLSKYQMKTVTVYASWIDVAPYKQINYVLGDATLPENAPTRYIPGEAMKLVPASLSGYIFRGWYNNPEFTGNRLKAISVYQTEDVTLYPLFVEAKPENLAVSVYGDSISTFVGYSPAEYPVYYPQHDVASVEDTWWYSAISQVGMNYCANASYSGGVVRGTTEASGTNTDRIKKLSQTNLDPDIVLIFMGINDVTNIAEKASVFKEQYLLMIENIKKQYPNVDILVCTLIYSTLGSEASYILYDEYNVVLRSIASENDLMLAELDLVITPENKDTYMANAKHPNKAGMKAIADCVAAVLRDKYLGE